jgi:mono/diheme cytochrome c family protein
MLRAVSQALFGLFLCYLPGANAQPVRDLPRGELLYTTHCSACHSAQIHWRQNKTATDMPSLVSEVRRWQRNAGQSWGNEDVESVARYLNNRYYQFPLQRPGK